MNKEKAKERVTISQDNYSVLKRWIALITIIVIYCSCNSNRFSFSEVLRIDIRFVNKYYSIIIDKTGDGYVEKGISTYYKEPFKVLTVIRSNIFTVDSVAVFWDRINTLKMNSNKADGESSAPRIEIHYNEAPIYDSYMWRDGIWDIFSLLIEKLPKGFNPFAVGDKPFE